MPTLTLYFEKPVDWADAIHLHHWRSTPRVRTQFGLGRPWSLRETRDGIASSSRTLPRLTSYSMITGDNFFCRDRIRFDTSGNAIDPHWRGNFKGLIEQLGYIRDLGFSAIWITPPVENRNTKAIETLPDHPLCNLRRRSLAI